MHWREDGAAICRNVYTFFSGVFSEKRSLVDNTQCSVLEQTLIILSSRDNEMWCSAGVMYTLVSHLCHLGDTVNRLGSGLAKKPDREVNSFWQETAGTPLDLPGNENENELSINAFDGIVDQSTSG